MPPGDTSRSAHRQHALDGKATTQLARILAFVRHAGNPVSRAQIAHAFTSWSGEIYLGRDKQGNHITSTVRRFSGAWDGGPPIPLASVCGRVNSVLEDPDLRDGLTRARPDDGQRDQAFLRVAYRAPGDRGHEVEFIEVIDPAPVQRTFAFLEGARA